MRFVVLLALCSAAAPASASDSGRASYLDLITSEAVLQGVPPALADAVAMVETGYRADAIGSSGEIGMMQVMPATARQLGFTGSSAELFLPANNVHIGVQYLARAWAISGGNVCRALMKYRAGLGEEMMTPLSITYCARAMAWLDTTGSDLSQSAPTQAAAPPAVDPHVIAMFPPLPEQAGLVAVPAQPALVTPAAYHTPLPAAPYRRTMADRNAAWQARIDSHIRHKSPVDKAAAAVEAALSDN